MKKWSWIIIVLILLLTSGFVLGITYPKVLGNLVKADKPSQNPLSEPKLNKNDEHQNTVAKLAQLKGRAAGSSYEKKAATILAREYVKLDLEPLPNKKNFYFQTFFVPKRESYKSGNRLRFRGVGKPINESQNVLGLLPGAHQDKILIITAHYDGQGINNDQVYESANDNLSGIYVLLSVAQALKNRPSRNLTYLFVAFGAEEIGLYGSEYFLNNLPVKKDHILGVINFDTVSTNSEKMLLQSFDQNNLVKNVETALVNHGFNVELELSKLRTSDHYPFSNAGLNALTIAAGDWLQGNHTPDDTLDKLNFPTLRRLSMAIVDMVLNMDDEHQSF